MSFSLIWPYVVSISIIYSPFLLTANIFNNTMLTEIFNFKQNLKRKYEKNF